MINDYILFFKYEKFFNFRIKLSIVFVYAKY